MLLRIPQKLELNYLVKIVHKNVWFTYTKQVSIKLFAFRKSVF